MKKHQMIKTEENESFLKKAFVLVLSAALVSALLAPGIAYADDGALDGQDASSVESEATENLDQENQGGLNGERSSEGIEGAAVSLMTASSSETDEERLAALSDTDATTVATVGAQNFSTIQEAIDSVTSAAAPAQATNYIIEIKAGIYNESLKFYQQANKNVTIKAALGATVVFTNSLLLDGAGRYYSEETFTLQGISFDFSGKVTSADCIGSSNMIMPGSTGTDHYSYLHNITIQNCAFIGNGYNGDIVGVRVTSGRTGEANNYAIKDCTTSSGMHSLAQFVGGTRGNLVFTGNTVLDTKGGINLFGSGQNVIFDNNNFDVITYALRFGSGSGALDASNSAALTHSIIRTKDAADGSIIFRGTSPKTVTISECEITNTNASGSVLQNTVAPGNTSGFVFSLSNNYWGPLGFVSSRIVGLGENTSIKAQGSTFITHLTFNPNGGSLVDDSQAQGLATIAFTADGSTKTALNFPAATSAGKVLLGWFTKPAGGDEILAATAKLETDTTLYAHWGTVEQQVTEIEQKIEAVLAKDANPDVEHVNAAVESLINADQATIDMMITTEDAKKIAAVETLFVEKNSDHIAATKIEAHENPSLTSVEVEGAALSVPLSNEKLHAQIDIKPVALDAIPAALPGAIDLNSLIPVDVTLSIADEDNNLVEGLEGIQPKAPLVVKVRVNSSGSLNPEKILILHYHEHDGRIETTSITPLSVTKEGNDLVITFTLTKLSKVVIGQLRDGTVDTPVGGSDNPDEGSENSGETSNNTGAHRGVQHTADNGISQEENSGIQPELIESSEENSLATSQSDEGSARAGETQPVVKTGESQPTDSVLVVVVIVAALALGAIVAIVLFSRRQAKKH